jgi:ParB family chromosome partitioning protein
VPDAKDSSQRSQSKRGIGRGLSAILPTTQGGEEGYRQLAIDLIEANECQPRNDFSEESLVELSKSIEARGVLQPIVVRPRPGGSYELIAGERRLRAAGIAGLERIPAIVRETDDSERLELALIENMAREDLNPVEEARACATLVEDLGITKEELGRRLGRSRVSISNLIRLLQLPDEAIELIEKGRLTEGHGRALLLVKDQGMRRNLARRCDKSNWSVRETEEHAKHAAQQLAGESEPVVIHPDLQDALSAAEDALTAAIGYEVKLRPMRNCYRAQIDLEDLRDGIALAERLMRGAGGAQAAA